MLGLWESEKNNLNMSMIEIKSDKEWTNASASNPNSFFFLLQIECLCTNWLSPCDRTVLSGFFLRRFLLYRFYWEKVLRQWILEDLQLAASSYCKTT